MKHIVKRGGHTEAFDPRKLYASVYTAAVSVQTPQPAAELIAQEVVRLVENWLGQKQQVTSNDLRRIAAKHLEVLHPDAAYMYAHHRVIW